MARRKRFGRRISTSIGQAAAAVEQLESRTLLSDVAFAVERVDYSAGDDPKSVTTADFYGDGKIGLAVADSNLAGLVRVGGYDTSGRAWGVSVVGSYAYVADETAGLQVIDISDPLAPVRVGGYDTSGNAFSVSVVGSYAYVADGDAGLQVIDISNPTAPVRVGGYDTSGWARGVSVVGSYAYVADLQSGLQVINISNPAAPVRVGGYDTSGFAYGVSVMGSYAYVADATAGLQVINISNPAAPVRVGGYDTSGSANGVSVVGSYAYVADATAGLQVINISNPAAPVRVGGYDTSGSACGVSVVGSIAYVADDTAGLQVIYVNNPAAPARVDGYDTSGTAWGVSVVGSYAYVADGAAGLQVIRIAGLPPMDVQLSGTGVAENQPSGTVVGTLSTTDPDAGDTFTYSLSGFPGSTDNSSFTISGNQLLSAATFDYESKSSYSIRVMTTDRDGLWFEKAFTIRVLDVPDGTVAFERVGRYGGTVAAVQVVGSRAYMAEGDSLSILDVSTPAAPLELGSINLSGMARGVSVVGSYAYVAVLDAGLQVIDISNPAAPVRVGGYNTSGYAYGISVMGSYAYVADEGAGLQVIDISNPADPVRVGGCYTSTAWGVSVVGSYAYVADDTAGLQVISISNPAAPVRVGNYNTSGTAYGVSVVGSYAYVADAVAGLQVIDISNPAAPVRVGGYDTSGYAYSVSVVGSYAYVADAGAGLQVIDISNPAVLVRVGSYDTSGNAWGVSVVGSYAYVADGGSGLQVIDISNPSAPVRVGGYDNDTSSYALGVSVVGSYAHVADRYAGLQVIDISNPAVPVRVGGYDTSGNAYGVSVVGSYAYVADYDAGLQVIDISNPAVPVRVGSYDTSGYAYGVSVVGSYAYVADGGAGLQVIDISSPAVPVCVGGYGSSGTAYGVSVVGSYAYVADGSAGLQVIDISSPAAPVRVGGYDTIGSAYGVSVVGSYAYVADEDAGLQVIDISNPATPVRVGGYDSSGYAYGVSVVGSYAYVANEDAGLQVIDIRDPAVPVRVGGYDSSGLAYGVSVVGSYAYVADMSAGLQVIRIAGLAPIDVQLSGISVAENQPSSSLVGTLSTTDLDIGDSFTYDLVLGTGSTDNSSFTISGNQLLTAASFDYEAKSSYSIRVRSADQDGLVFEKRFTITVTDVNEVPADIALSSTSVNEGELPGAVVGVLSSSDPDVDDTFTYTLVGGAGADDNASFTIEGDALETATIFSAAAKSSYSICVRSRDAGGLWVERTFGITVTTSGVTSAVWSSYLGGSSEDCGGAGIALDASGNAWVTGYTYSSGWTSGGFDTSFNGGTYDAFVAKINANGTLGWSSYLGGSGDDSGSSIALDAAGNAWITGGTSSSDWISGGFDTSYNGGTYDAFVAKINADGTLAWSSYLGGSGYDQGRGIALDASGNAWVTGYTTSSGWTSGGFDTGLDGTSDAFVAKINADGTLAWSSYLGGNSYESGSDIRLDGSGNAWVTGTTGSSGWTSGGFDTGYNGGGRDAFVAKVNANGTLAWSSYLGGNGSDYGEGIVLDAAGNAWITGGTSSSDSTSGGFDTSYNGGTYDAFVAKINANGTLAWSSYLGGGGEDYGFSVALDGSGDAWVTGYTASSGWTSGGFDTSFNGGNDDVFVAGINADGTLGWSSYLGGSNSDEGFNIALDGSGNAWVTGYTASSGWTSGGFDTTYNGGGDTFVAKISLNLAPTALELSSSTIAENQPAGTVVGNFSSTDSDAGDTFTYSLVSGEGSTDNAAFQVVGNQLQTTASFDYEIKSSYSVRVRTTDEGGLVFEKVFTISVTDVDEIAPTVTAVYVRGSTWNTNYLSFLAGNLVGSSATYGYAIPVGSGAAQLQTLPWRNLNRISVAFSEDVTIAQAQFAIAGSVGSYAVSGFSYSSVDHVATWSLSAAMGPDKLYVAVPGSGVSAITDLAGNVLDGEWNNPSSYGQGGSTRSFPSGNGSAGGDFAFRLDVLPGDSTGGSLGKVNVADIAQTKSRSNLDVSLLTYRSDFDGNNLVNVADIAYVKTRSNVYSLPANSPVLPVFELSGNPGSLLLTSAGSLLS